MNLLREVGGDGQGEHNSCDRSGNHDDAGEVVALGLLMVPFVASRVVDGWNWPARAFVIVSVPFFATGMAYAEVW